MKKGEKKKIMFENIKRCTAKPLRDNVTSICSATVLAKLITAEMEILYGDPSMPLSDVSDLYAYVKSCVESCVIYEMDYTLRDVYWASKKDDFEMAINEYFPFEEADKNKDEEHILNKSGREIFVVSYGRYDSEPENLKQIKSELPEKSEAAQRKSGASELKNVTYKTLKDALDESVVGQDEAKKKIITGVLKHCMKAKNPDVPIDKSNILLVGPSGCGKTEIIRVISKALGVPMVTEDANAFTEAGYRGRDAIEMLYDLITAADGNIERAEHGIIYIDEIDKLCISAENSQSSYRRGDQASFLTLVEGAEVMLLDRNRDRFSMSTKDILVIAGGAFEGIKQKKSESEMKSAVGFMRSLSPYEGDKTVKKKDEITHADLIKFGMMRELAGRFSCIAELKPLSVDDLFRISKQSKNSVLRQYEALFLSLGKDKIIDDDTVMELCKKAYAEGTGARALKTVFDSFFEKLFLNVISKEEKGNKNKRENAKIYEKDI